MSLNPRFKIGDRVRVVRPADEECDGSCIGRTGTVIAIDDSVLGDPNVNDGYTVAFVPGEIPPHDLFWDEELEPAL